MTDPQLGPRLAGSFIYRSRKGRAARITLARRPSDREHAGRRHGEAEFGRGISAINSIADLVDAVIRDGKGGEFPDRPAPLDTRSTP
jgi:hypothetical protein